MFYTAITRAKINLKIYWSGESQKKILSSFTNNEISNDAMIFSARIGIKIVKRKGR